jgi:hypothetical protein
MLTQRQEDSRMDYLRVALHATLPALSGEGSRFLDFVIDHRGAPGAPRFVAASLGLASRHQLRRLLQREGLPSYEIVSAWVRVLYWVAQWEFEGVSLCELALKSGADPASLYRTVRRVTGMGWSEARGCGTGLLALRFREHCLLAVGTACADVSTASNALGIEGVGSA